MAEIALGSALARPTRLSFDTDLDNQVSEVEFKSRLRSSFTAMDDNEDGELSRSEMVYLALLPTPRPKREKQPRLERRP